MASDVDVNVQGVKDVLSMLKKIPESARKNVLRGMLKSGSDILLDEAKSNVPVRTGNLRESLAVIPRKSRDKNIIRYSLTPLKSKTKTKRFKVDGKTWSITGEVANGFYAHMVEFGTKNMKAQPFLRPVESKADEAYEAGRKYVEKRFNKVIEGAK